ncbi:MAG: thioredoxin family protein, partial [Anaerolineae bacterium]
MNDLWFKIRGYVAAAVALVACPCHLLVTLPLLLSLAAGTALGAFLQQNTWLVYGASTALFVGGLFLTFRWMDQPMATANTQARRPRPRRQRMPAPTQSSSSGLPKVTLVHAPSCPTCPQAQTIWRELQQQIGFDYEEVNIITERGRGLAATYGIMSTPVTLIDGEVAFRGAPSPDEALLAV